MFDLTEPSRLLIYRYTMTQAEIPYTNKQVICINASLS